MEFELEPMEGENLLPAEERERMLSRIKPVEESLFRQFNEKQQQYIKSVLVKLIILCESIHHDIQDKKHESQLRMNNQKRQELMQNLEPIVQKYFQLLDITSAEPWLSWETLLELMQSDINQEYYDMQNKTGIEAAENNPFLVKIEGISNEQINDLNQKGRLTASKIEDCVYHFNLFQISELLIKARKIITGTFWNREYDL